MRFIKSIQKLIIFIAFLQFLIQTSTAQEYYKGKLQVHIKEQSAIPENNTHTHTSNSNLNAIFDKYKVFNYKQLMPFAKNQELREIYEIEFECEDDKLINELEW